MNSKIKRDFLLRIVLESNTIKKNISNKKRKQLFENIKNLSDEKVDKLCSILEIQFDFGKMSNKLEKGLLAFAITPVPGSEALYIVYKIITMYNYKCAHKCLTGNSLDKKLCYKKCAAGAIEKGIDKAKLELGDCWYHKNPDKCKKECIEYIQLLYQKLEKTKIALVKYQIQLQAQIERKKNAKLQQNK